MEHSTLVRTIALLIITVLIFCIFGVSFFRLQVVNGEEYSKNAEKTYVQTVSVNAARGEIVDRYGRPIAVNTMGFNVVFEYSTFPEDGKEINNIIERLINLLSTQDESWNNNLPIVYENNSFEFVEGMDTQVSKLKTILGLQPFASAQNAFDEMCEQYDIDASDPDRALTIAAVRYEMERRNFSSLNPYVFAEDVSNETATYIKENSSSLPGVEAEETSLRSYVTGYLMPHIVGRTGPIYYEEY